MAGPMLRSVEGGDTQVRLHVWLFVFVFMALFHVGLYFKERTSCWQIGRWGDLGEVGGEKEYGKNILYEILKEETQT